MESNLQFDNAHGYGSEFSDCNSEVELSRKQKKYEKDTLLKKPNLGRVGIYVAGSSHIKPPKRTAENLKDVEEAKRMRYHGLLAMDAYTRHKKMVNDYLLLYGGKLSDFKRDSSKDRTDYDVIKENHQFLWDDDDDDDSEITWGKRLAKKYWDKLFKEYTICDLSRYKEKKIAFRWRTEKEVVSGKGQFSCANKRCSERDGLRSWEVNFSYLEAGEKKNALVKCRLCPDCSYKLNYHHKKKDVTGLKKSGKKSRSKRKKSREVSSPDATSTSSDVESSPNKNQEQKIWSQPLKVENEKSREEEFDEYFEGLFL